VHGHGVMLTLLATCPAGKRPADGSGVPVHQNVR